MDRDVIKLTNQQWENLVQEDYLEIDGEHIHIEVVQENYNDSGRHTEYHDKVFKVISTGKFYRIDYETSVKDEMGWEECNYGDTKATEVFPKEVTTIIYE